ncbi:hypothetical protein CRENBAI_023676 [Crenichthys baileyi]|uniref:glutaminase n=1 Tax=Crenichthys baileyi TaxID=28760 RepID=A0AAV9RHQ6_9TELE
MTQEGHGLSSPAFSLSGAPTPSHLPFIAVRKKWKREYQSGRRWAGPAGSIYFWSSVSSDSSPLRFSAFREAARLAGHVRTHISPSQPGRIEMLHFRFSTVLKECFEATVKRPFPSCTQKSWSPAPRQHRCFGSVPGDAARAAARRTAPCAAPLRSYCVKTEGAAAVQLDEHLKKDGVEGDKRRNPGILPSLEDLLFYTVAEGQEKIPAHKFLTALKATGLRTGDPRLKECMETLKETLKKTPDGVTLDRHLFKKCVQSNIVLLTQAFRKKFVIPDFQSFTSHIDELYEKAKKLSGGQVADYIPQLAKFSPDLWAVSLCTVDGQRHTVGDTKVPFCLQSCVKPLKYAVAVNDHGTAYVHSFIGKEPSGLRFNKLFLNEDDKPHNSMVNAGAIVCTSLIQQAASNAEKFDYVMNFLKKMAGNEYVGFSNATFQSERESGDRNFAIGYYLKEKKLLDRVSQQQRLTLYSEQITQNAKGHRAMEAQMMRRRGRKKKIDE